jgi:hypothetical protein
MQVKVALKWYHLAPTTDVSLSKEFLVDVIAELSVKRQTKNDDSYAKSWARFLFPRSQEETYISGGTVSNAADHVVYGGYCLIDKNRIRGA